MMSSLTTAAIDVDGDGIDDRGETRFQGWDGFRLWLHTAFGSKPGPPPQPSAKVQLGHVVAMVRDKPTGAIPGWKTRSLRLDDGYEYLEPRASVVAQLAGLGVEVACLAAVLASEAPSIKTYPQYALAIGWAVRNECQARGLSIYRRVTMAGLSVSGKPARAGGHFGRQTGRWCASLQTPNERHLGAAQLVLDGFGGLWSGARRWVDLRTMRKGMQAGKRLAYDDEGLVRKWSKEGWHWIGPVVDQLGEPLIDPYVLMLFARQGEPLDSALAAMLDGRRRWGL